jgi:hypothetical protein
MHPNPNSRRGDHVKRPVSVSLTLMLMSGLLTFGMALTPEAAHADGPPQSQQFSYTGGLQNFVVPPTVTSLTVAASGAAGGGDVGGLGGELSPPPFR